MNRDIGSDIKTVEDLRDHMEKQRWKKLSEAPAKIPYTDEVPKWWVDKLNTHLRRVRRIKQLESKRT